MSTNEYGDDLGDDDIPWADPQIQKDYEAALGAFLVRFNRIENMIARLVRHALSRLDRQDLLNRSMSGPLKQRVQALDLILLAFPAFPKLPISGIDRLSAVRNSLAHGHFEQNPYDGDYEIVGKSESRTWHPNEIQGEAAVADSIWTELRLIEAHFLFFDVPELPDGGRPL